MLVKNLNNRYLYDLIEDETDSSKDAYIFLWRKSVGIDILFRWYRRESIKNGIYLICG